MKKHWIFALFLTLLLLSSCALSRPDTIQPQSSGASDSDSDTDAAQQIPEDAAQPLYRLHAADQRIPSLAEHFDGVMKIGAAVNAWQLSENADIYQVLTKQYNAFVLENEMKPERVNPAPGVYRLDAGDTFAQFGEETGAVLRGHTLVWHSQVPAWWFEGSGEDGRATQEELLTRMEEYITTLVTHYRGKIDTWDVVNEAFSDNGSGLRGADENSLWTSIIGDLDGDGSETDYIEQAFYFARAADPEAQLILNDYNLEGDPVKLEAFYQTVKAMLEKGVPIDGVGIQGHINLGWPSVESFEAAIEKLASLKEYNPDFVVQITELDVSIFEWGDESLEKETDLILQTQFAARYADLFDMFARQAEKGNLDMVLTWGVYDGGSWLNNYPVEGRTNAPLLFDRDMKAKPAFWAIIDREVLPAVFEEWR